MKLSNYLKDLVESEGTSGREFKNDFETLEYLAKNAYAAWHGFRADLAVNGLHEDELIRADVVMSQYIMTTKTQMNSDWSQGMQAMQYATVIVALNEVLGIWTQLTPHESICGSVVEKFIRALGILDGHSVSEFNHLFPPDVQGFLDKEDEE
jgi:hypothetical protein